MIVKQVCGIFLAMSDEATRLAEGMIAAPRPAARIENHLCEHAGCGMRAPFGFARPRQTPHWFCLAHRAAGDRYL
ncbi:hypothetical protein [Mesorhizobium sp. dw_380]|uniref:hypothetical protein n=1 Tax=Mesorhizobium sp. dw_380 TaxID=2812001 RepID=UPI001BDED992|nr:hypothetical protein [Mesorhizobium sp. dw_380]